LVRAKNKFRIADLGVAGWLTDSASAAVPPSRIAERRAITPERL
jgi:hypothetical protein